MMRRLEEKNLSERYNVLIQATLCVIGAAGGDSLVLILIPSVYIYIYCVYIAVATWLPTRQDTKLAVLTYVVRQESHVDSFFPLPTW